MDDHTPPPDDAPRRGRPTKFTDEIALGIAQCIVDGNFRYVAGARFGVGKRTFQTWMRSGLNFPDSQYGTFRRLILECEAEAERVALRAIMRAGLEDDPKHLEWWLERKFPERWGRFRGELAELKRRMRELERELMAREIADRQPD